MLRSAEALAQARSRRCSGVKLIVGLVLVLAVALAPATAAQAKKGGTVWLCKPGMGKDPCKSSRTSTVVSYEGATRKEAVARQKHTKKPKVDCFYVYPTVSEQSTINANLDIEPAEKDVAITQASRFSEVCNVYAPMYPQLTLKAIDEPEAITEEDLSKAYFGVQSAFSEYLKKYNKGHGFVLIGHSQGAALLEELVKLQLDPNATLRKQLVSAILLGGNVLVPEGAREGGTFENVPSCQSEAETGCVVAYSSFAQEPPLDSFFGRPGSSLLEHGKAPEHSEVVCVNPTLATQNGGTGALLPYAPTTAFPGTLGEDFEHPEASTPWVEALGLVTAQCKHENGASWLQISTAPGQSEPVLEERVSHHEIVQEKQGPEWGLHIYDVNLALGNLVKMVAAQVAAY